jgi:SMI1-KNR4 cell-wall
MEFGALVAARVVEVVCRCFGARPNAQTVVSDAELDAAEKELGVCLPAVYRAFMSLYGSRSVPVCDLYGLPRDGMLGDVVMMNEFDPERLPGLVKIGEDGHGRSFYLDTSRVDEDGDCLVVVRVSGGDSVEVVPSFVDFLAGASRSALPAEAQGGVSV